MNIAYYCGVQANGNMDVAEIHYDNGEVCRVEMPYYMNGQKRFKCISGKAVDISGKAERLINTRASKRFEMEHITPSTFRALRVKFESLLRARRAEFSNWKTGVDWACAELDISSQLLQCMYPTVQAYLNLKELLMQGHAEQFNSKA